MVAANCSMTTMVVLVGDGSVASLEEAVVVPTSLEKLVAPPKLMSCAAFKGHAEVLKHEGGHC